MKGVDKHSASFFKDYSITISTMLVVIITIKMSKWLKQSKMRCLKSIKSQCSINIIQDHCGTSTKITILSPNHSDFYRLLEVVWTMIFANKNVQVFFPFFFFFFWDAMILLLAQYKWNCCFQQQEYIIYIPKLTTLTSPWSLTSKFT